MEEEKKSVCEKILESVENKLDQLANEGVMQTNVDYVYKLIDIHKDIKNEEYWKEKIMRYRNYSNYEDSYGRGRARDSRGRYMGDDSYGRRGVPGTGRGYYRGDEMADDMYEAYRDYSDSSSYGHDDESDKSFEYMMKKGVEFIDTLEDEAKTPRQREMIKKFREEVGNR